MKRHEERQEGKAPDWLDRVVEEIYARRQEGESPSLAFLLESLLNEIMRRERERFLRLNQGEQANGFYQRRLHLTLGKLNLKVPRVRYGKAFRPAILPPPWKRADKDYEELLIAMLANGYSQAQMERALKSLSLPFSQDALQDALALIEEKLSFYKTQPLKEDWFAIFIDGYWAKLRTREGKLQDITLFVAVGIDLDGNKEILGFWVQLGKEKKSFWVEVFQDLVNRGVCRVLLFVTDDFQGIHEVIEKLFPYADHQLCHLHLRRNLRRELSGKAYKEAGGLLYKLRRADDPEEGEALFRALCEVVKEEKPDWAGKLLAKADCFLAFLRYPEEVRKHIYTTNVVESVNAGIEHMRLELGGYFPSQRCLEVNLFIQVVNLQDRWWRRPLPTVRSVSYKLRQLFTLRYELAEEPMSLHNV
jgi:transposase-like protein